MSNFYSQISFGSHSNFTNFGSNSEFFLVTFQSLKEALLITLSHDKIINSWQNSQLSQIENCNLEFAQKDNHYLFVDSDFAKP